ncbi:hypothetical protein GCM10009737_10850 [Nocardioides lentus]|uniref:Uncharacterized protein n=1 Tax=Nocardioides lentus TaxID=338077 RepID=A0ABP5AJF4_9ACTN
MSEPEKVPCFRFPCDTAHTRGKHTLRDGEVCHEVHWGSESMPASEGDDRGFVTAWTVRSIAWEDGPWHPYIYVRNERRTMTDPTDAARLADAIHTANRHALESNLREKSGELEDAEALARDQADELTQLEKLLEVDA